MKTLYCGGLVLLLCILLNIHAFAAEIQDFDMQEQLDALGADELMQQVPQGARELLEEVQLDNISPETLLNLSPRAFFKTLWELLVRQVKTPVVVLTTVLGIIILCSLLEGFGTAVGESAANPVFTTVSVLCILTSIAVPILDCIIQTSEAVRQASMFMLSFIPMFSASLMAAGQPITGATYNMFLFTTCQIVSQVVAQTLVPLMGVFLALCFTGAVVPAINISSATSTIKSVVSWVLGFISTIFVGLLSIQTMVAQSADSVSTRAAKFLLGSFVPVVGSALSEAYTAAQGCLRLLKTSLGAYGIIVAALTFLPILLQTVIWLLLTNFAVIGSDILGVPKVSSILKSCSSVLGILIAVILSYVLLIIVSTTVILVTSGGSV